MTATPADAVFIFWFRRDLRLSDNAGLYYALKTGLPVVPVFIFDTDILGDLKDKKDKRVDFIYRAILQLQEQLVKKGSTLHVLQGTPLQCFGELMTKYRIVGVYTNHDYEPYATERDERIKKYLDKHGVSFHTYKDQVIFEKSEVVKDSGDPYTVYTPYSRKWKERLNDFFLTAYPVEKYMHNLVQADALPIPSLSSLGFLQTDVDIPRHTLNEHLAQHYDKTRDFPAQKGTTRLSVHLRFGTISIRDLATRVRELNTTLLNELVWREFYMMILWHYPKVVTESFRKEYDNIRWRNNHKEFDLWCAGQTGIPVVDAGMRELNETGFMHNRVRMIVASFLTKNLLVDWRWGEAYFAEKLLDYDLAANNGGWQWAAGTGCDAAPYFRVFNPMLQTQKFDPGLAYVRKWVPELESLHYKPIVDLKASRERCLAEYKRALNSAR